MCGHALFQGAYIVVGWIVLSIAKLFIGDPLTIYLEATHSDVMSVVSMFLSLAVQAAVGAAVLHASSGLIVVDHVNISRRMELVRLYDASWDVSNPDRAGMHLQCTLSTSSSTNFFGHPRSMS